MNIGCSIYQINLTFIRKKEQSAAEAFYFMSLKEKKKSLHGLHTKLVNKKGLLWTLIMNPKV